MQKTTTLTLVLAFGCAGSPSGGIPRGMRLVTGEIRVADGDLVPNRQPLQLVALFLAADCTKAVRVGAAPGGAATCAYFGDPFDPAGEPARLVAPCDVTVNILVQRLGQSGGQAPGDSLGLLTFPTGVTADETTSLLAREASCRDTPKLATNFIDLGEVTVSSSAHEAGPPAVLVGGPSGGENPLATVDTDGDASANAADADDDNDGTPDSADDDRDGDGVTDAAQSFSPDWLSSQPYPAGIRSVDLQPPTLVESLTWLSVAGSAQVAAAAFSLAASSRSASTIPSTS